MTKSIFCRNLNKSTESIRVKIIKAPLVDSGVLKQVLTQRQKALVL
ncbi:MAG: hypothetical protein HYV53_02920 [Parcubacteria group bacterium]|nr:hypothetical protein [Parcubacteria group bacterium]